MSKLHLIRELAELTGSQAFLESGEICLKTLNIVDIRLRSSMLFGFRECVYECPINEIGTYDRWCELPAPNTTLVVISNPVSEQYIAENLDKLHPPSNGKLRQGRRRALEVWKQTRNATPSSATTASLSKSSPEEHSQVLDKCSDSACRNSMLLFTLRGFVTVTFVIDDVIASTYFSNVHPELLRDLRVPFVETLSNCLWRPSPILEIVQTCVFPNIPEPRFALDFGCGSGRDTVFMALHGLHVIACDVRADSLRRTASLARRYGIPVLDDDELSSSSVATKSSSFNEKAGSVKTLHTNLKKFECYERIMDCLQLVQDKVKAMNDSISAGTTTGLQWRKSDKISAGFDFVFVGRFLLREIFPVLRCLVSNEGGYLCYHSFVEGSEHPCKDERVLKAGELANSFGPNISNGTDSWEILLDEVRPYHDTYKRIMSFFISRKNCSL